MVVPEPIVAKALVETMEPDPSPALQKIDVPLPAKKEVKLRGAKLKRDINAPGKRVIEYSILTVFFSLSVWNTWRAVDATTSSVAWVVAPAFLAAQLTADLISGLLHWGFDTWGDVDQPFFGPFIKSFREHHLFPTEMCLYDWVESNAQQSGIAIPFLVLMAASPVEGSFYLFAQYFIVMACLITAFANQVHKWAHMHKPPLFARVLQTSGLVIGRQGHKKHHAPPFDRGYCISNGWLNPFLDSINFWRNLEAVVTLLTGAIPREDDANWTEQIYNGRVEKNE